MMKKVHILTAFLSLSISLVPVSFQSVSAASINSVTTYPKVKIYSDYQQWKHAIAQARKFVLEHNQESHLSAKEDANRIQKLLQKAGAAAAKKHDKVEFDRYLTQYDAIVYDPNLSGVQPYSVNTDVTMNRPTIAYYSTSGRYSVDGTYSWKDTSYPEADNSYQLGNEGGEDSEVLSFSSIVNPQNILSWGGYAYNWYGDQTFVSYNPSSEPRNGNALAVNFQSQDQIAKDSAGYQDYTWYSGDVNVVFDSGFGNETGNVNLVYGHDWSSTTLNNVSINTTGDITFDFSSTNNSWKAPSLFAGY